MNFIDDLESLYEQQGARLYEIKGRSGVTQLQHALQCAALAAQANAPETLVAAALLHDLGHLVHDKTTDELSDNSDDIHQFSALPFLRPYFATAVLEPIRLHVDAKRFLCGKVPGYWETLSEGSKRSLELQGGPFSSDDANTFIAQPFANDAVQLRRWDDLAKDTLKQVPAFEAYRPMLQKLMLQPVA